MRVQVLPGTVLNDNRKKYYSGDELEMEDKEAFRRIAQDKVKAVEPGGKLSAADAIAAVNACATIEELTGIAEGEDRKSVLAAIEARKAGMSA